MPQGARDPHWQFAVALYERPGVARCCLALQERCGVDVVMLLFALFLACRCGRTLSAEQLAAAEACIGQWRRRAVAPLRTLRIRLKGSPRAIAPAQRERLRSKVAEAEQLAERIELDLLLAWATGALGGGRQGSPEPAELVALAERVVGIYTGAAGRGTPAEPEVGRAIADICTNARALV